MGVIAMFVFLFLLAVGGLVFFLRRQTTRKAAPRYGEKQLLTKSEAILFGRLCRALPNCYIFPKIALSALLQPAEVDRKHGLEHFDGIGTFWIDYAVYDHDLELVCVVILEPDSSDFGKNPLLERCLKGAGIKTIRWSSTTRPSVEQISRAIMPLTNNTQHSLESDNTINQNTVQLAHEADPVPGNINGLTTVQLDQLTPGKVLSKNYPHIWQRICLFAPDPKHLQKYLLSLSIQDRGEKRAGFPIEALQEITDIQTANDQFSRQPVTGWQPSFIHR